ncbi:hypothetical protein [Hymenobacter psychrophilus]|uniref:Lipoprotein n=1 Tax=Hymenobacter psychrophilus TaxID=651662 RepID=A0A1H3P2C0_9BACT|nr:hypothetical protein [Hymenobacter psychrophilus]SDY95191.1 hypothetical protein SAMN04488069_1213 [Hymenobacter psychrophilus]
MRYVCFLLLALLLAACGSPTTSGPYPQNPAISDAQGHPRDSTTFYFPVADTLHDAYLPEEKRPDGIYYNTDIRFADCADELKHASYVLNYFDAPVLSNYYLGADIVRFLWLRSFHRPVLLTLRHDSAGTTLNTRLLDKIPGFQIITVQHPDSLSPTASDYTRKRTRKRYNESMADPEFQKLVAEGKRRARRVETEETTVAVSPEQWQQFQRLLRTSRFQQLPACKPRPGMLDGAYWLLETHRADGYHMAARQTPDATDPFRQACAYLIELSSARGEKRY